MIWNEHFADIVLKLKTMTMKYVYILWEWMICLNEIFIISNLPLTQ